MCLSLINLKKYIIFGNVLWRSRNKILHDGKSNSALQHCWGHCWIFSDNSTPPGVYSSLLFQGTQTFFFSENPSEENQVCYYCRGNKLRQIYLWYLTSQSWMFCSCGLYKEWNSPVSPCCPGAPGLPGKPVGPIRPTSPGGPGVPGGPGGPAGPGLLLCMPLGIWFNIALYRLIWPWRRAVTY